MVLSGPGIGVRVSSQVSRNGITRPTVLVTHGGSAARIQLFLISFFERILRPLHHHGLWQVIHFLARFFSPENAAMVSDGRWKFKIYLADGYWTRWMVDGFTYEDEIAKVLDLVLTSGSVFIDCGANNGYWSLYAASKIGVSDRVVAIEAGETNFRRLCENMELNSGCFRAVRKAIFSESDLKLLFRTHPLWHASNACVVDAEDAQPEGYVVESVQSVTIDDVFNEIPLENRRGEVIVKIDVEGAEIAALKGAKKLIGEGALVIYEDHGDDLASLVTDYILREYGLRVYFLHRDERVISEVDNIEQLAKLKKRAHRGYNLLAGRMESPALCRLLDSLRADKE
jgi:FkbM family methyltransferase